MPAVVGIYHSSTVCPTVVEKNNNPPQKKKQIKGHEVVK